MSSALEALAGPVAGQGGDGEQQYADRSELEQDSENEADGRGGDGVTEDTAAYVGTLALPVASSSSSTQLDLTVWKSKVNSFRDSAVGLISPPARMGH